MANHFRGFLLPVFHFSIASVDVGLIVYYRGLTLFCPNQLRGWIYGQFVIHIWEGVISSYRALRVHRITARPGGTICLFFELCWLVSALLIGFTSTACAKTYPGLYSALFIGAAILISLISSRECISTYLRPTDPPPLLSAGLVDVSFNGLKDAALNETCVFCMEEFGEDDRVVSLSCKHIYHPRVIRAWLSTSQSCPLCRNPVENL